MSFNQINFINIGLFNLKHKTNCEFVYNHSIYY